MTARQILARFGYDPDRIRHRPDHDGPDRLLQRLGQTRLLDEADINPHPGFRSVPGDPLTRGELAVLACLSHGMTQPMAADTLGVSTAAVNDRIRNARFKLRAKNTAHAVAIAVRRGIIR